MASDFQSFYQENLARELKRMLPESILDRYEGISCLAQGDGGEVYLVKRKSDGMHVVLRAAKGGAAAAAAAEFDILKSLDNERIPRPLEIIKTEAYTYAFRQYFPGQTLARYVRTNGVMRKDELIDVALQLCAALTYLHARQPQVIHRDIKPENIILDEEGRVRLVDFGIARVYRDGATSDTVTIGTRPYMAPEQFGGMQTDGRADLFSLGVVMIFMGTGRHDRTNLALRYPYRDLLPVINKLTAIDPSRRYAGANRLARELAFIRWGGMLRAGRVLAAVSVSGALAAGAFFAGQGRGYNSGLAFGEKWATEVVGAARYDEGLASGYDKGYATGYDEGMRYSQYLQQSGLDAAHGKYFPVAGEMGNTPSNTANEGLAVTDGKNIYVCTANGIERMPMDASSREVFLPHTAKHLNLFGGMLYFIHEDRVWRAPLDGGEAERICDLSVQKIIVADGRIYFGNNSDKGTLHAMALDGTDVQKLNEIQRAFYWTVAGGSMFYMDDGARGQPFRCNLDGSGVRQLDSGLGGVGLTALGEYLFFMEYDSHSYIRLDLDGSNRTVIAEGTLNSVNISPYGIFFSNGQKAGLYHVSLDGNLERALLGQPCARINVAGEWVFFSSGFDTTDLYRVRIDGALFERMT